MTSQSMTKSLEPYKTARVEVPILPDDANPAGNTHGGTILKLVEACGYIAASRFVNSKRDADDTTKHGGVTLLTARMERMDFLQPMCIGEVASLRATVVYTSQRTVETRVEVEAEDVIKGTRRRTNNAIISFVPQVTADGPSPTLPTVVPETAEEQQWYDEGHARYQLRQGKRRDNSSNSLALQQEDAAVASTAPSESRDVDGPRAPSDSETTLCQMMLPSDCMAGAQVVRGGVIFKLMDNAAGVVACKHCRSNVVTACVDSISMLEPLHNGGVAHITARVAFVSAKSMEVAVWVWGEDLLDPSVPRKLLTTGLFTFVSLGATGRVQPIPPLRLDTPRDRELFEEGQARYEENKKKRAAAGAGK